MNMETIKKENKVALLKLEQEKQLRENRVPIEFPESIASLTEEDFVIDDSVERRDFRSDKVFTLDCDSCKDMDDAISVTKDINYHLNVHIADVSAYVTPLSELEQIIQIRGTSHYLPDMTIPMLPPVLSENLCSLNAGKDRYTLSVLMEISPDGELLNYELTKGIIRSRVKGVYSEVNLLLNGSRDYNLLNKYREVSASFADMVSLYKVLRAQRIKRGSQSEHDNKPIITVTKNKIKIVPRKRGLSEDIIEEFMIEANYAVSLYLAENDLPAIFRVQDAEKDMASYQPTVTHHKSLELESYVHYTSPIRRCSDYYIHKSISLHLAGYNSETIHAIYDEEFPFICSRATKRSRTAKSIQNKCERFCYEAFFTEHHDNRHIGSVVGFDDRSFPIIRINDYNLSIISYSIVGGHIGDKYSFNVGMGKTSNRLVACKLRRLSA